MANVPLGRFKGMKVSVKFGGVIAFVACFQSEDGTFFVLVWYNVCIMLES